MAESNGSTLSRRAGLSNSQSPIRATSSSDRHHECGLEGSSELCDVTPSTFASAEISHAERLIAPLEQLSCSYSTRGSIRDARLALERSASGCRSGNLAPSLPVRQSTATPTRLPTTREEEEQAQSQAGSDRSLSARGGTGSPSRNSVRTLPRDTFSRYR